MAGIYLLKTVQRLPVPLEQAWDFFSRPQNLLAITPPFLNLKVRGEVFGEETYPGQIITYRVRPLLGIPVSWVTEITHVERLRFFVDEQRKGPYGFWHHQHHFLPIEGGTQMTDLVHYALPLDPLGRLALPLVKGQLQKIFDFRRKKVEELFGPWRTNEQEMGYKES